MDSQFFKKLILSIIPLLLFNSSCSDHKTDFGLQEDANTFQSEFTIIGPGGGGGVMKPTISPFDENIVMVHCDMTAAYITTDGGAKWKMKNLWNVPEDFEFDPVDPDKIYVATRGFRHDEDRGSGLSTLLRSENGGKSWRIIYPDLNKIKVKTDRLQNSDLLPSEIIEGAFDGTIEKIKVDPNNPARIYLGMAPLVSYMSSGNKANDNNTATLILSTDKGLSWREITKLPGKNIKAIIPGSDYGKTGEVIVFTESACVRINEKTGKSKNYSTPAERIIVADGGKSRSGYLMYIVSDFGKGNKTGGVYLSKDLGVSWTQVNHGLSANLAKNKTSSFSGGFAICKTRPEVAYISIETPSRDKHDNIINIYSIYKTTDAGENWSPVFLSSTPDGYITKNFKGSWMEKSFDPGWGGSPFDLGVAPGNPEICYAGDNGRCYKTLDGGKSWEQVYSNNQPDGSYTTRGLDVTTCYGVHFDPYNKAHLFICYTDIGLFHSFNGGKSWLHSNNGVPRDWQNTCYQILFDPEVNGKVWSVWANAHDLPRSKMFGDWGFDSYLGGVALSEDSGRTWNLCNKGLPENSICTNILLDHDSQKDSRILYVSVFDKGVYKSIDGGMNWVKSSKGLSDNLFAWQIRQNSDGRLFVLLARGIRKRLTVDGAIYYSDDKAETWKQLTLPDRVNGPHDLLLDPNDTKLMYISCWPQTINGVDVHGGVLKTVDAGKSWKQVFDARVRVNSAALNAKNPNVIFINTFQNAAYRSDNSGETWHRIEGYRFKWGQRVIPDINNPGMLFLTTYGGSVFYGPDNGIPGIQDDIENMPEGWW